MMHRGLCVLGGFLLGTVGVKVARSNQVRRAAVRVTACGLQCKDYVAQVIDEAKAECDDIRAEAEFINEVEAAEREAACAPDNEMVIVVEEEGEPADEEPAAEDPTPKKRATRTRKRTTTKKDAGTSK